MLQHYLSISKIAYIVYADGYRKHCYLVLANFMVNYKKQVFITKIKINM